MGNKGLGSSKERGRNLVPKTRKILRQLLTKEVGRIVQTHTSTRVLPFIGPPIRITTFIMVSLKST